MVIVVGRELHVDGVAAAIVATAVATDFSCEFRPWHQVCQSEGRCINIFSTHVMTTIAVYHDIPAFLVGLSRLPGDGGGVLGGHHLGVLGRSAL